MKAELEAALKKARVNKRKIAELNALKAQVSQQTAPDPKLVKMIEEELASLQK